MNKYINIRGRKIIDKNGGYLKEVERIITPKDAEEEELCQYFVSIGNLKKLKAPQTELQKKLEASKEQK